jgi:3'(2'), 5'-bisphosphate nucleotidase
VGGARLLDAVRRITADAAVVALRHYADAALRVERKADDSPVTAADRAVSELICARLERLTPGVAVVSEETAGPGQAVPVASFWLVDPLDGTKEFIKRTGEFTINIALIEDGRPLLGAVHVPVSGRSFYAAAGAGAYAAEAGGAEERIATRAARRDGLAVVASRDHAGPLVSALLGRLAGATTLSMGSSLKFCLVAAGRADLYLRDVPTMEWDTAAAQCVVEQAGGAVTDLEGAPLRYGKPELRNPSIMTIGDPTLPWKTFLS